MHSFTRRTLLKGAAVAGATCALPAALRRDARAQARVGPPRHLIVVMAGGGWDTTYALDPKPGRPLVDTPDGAFRRRGDLAWWSHPSRPAVDRFFERWGDRTAVVNGVQVRSFIHTDCMKRILTGGPSESAPDLAAIAAAALGPDLPVPYLALGSFARSGTLAAFTGRTGTTNQLAALVDPAAAYPDAAGRPNPGLRPTEGEASLVRRYLEASSARLRATRGSTGYNARRIDDFVASLSRAERLAAFGGGSTLGAREFTPQLAVQVPLAVRALAEGLSHTAYVQTSVNWDTHTDNALQSLAHEELFGALDTLGDALVGRDLVDRTLVVVLSEMGRTPRLNGQRGKDHWPVTSAMLFGAGVAGGRLLGGTDDELDALSISLETGAAEAATGRQLQTGNLVAGILEHVGVDPGPHVSGSEPFRAFRA